MPQKSKQENKDEKPKEKGKKGGISSARQKKNKDSYEEIDIVEEEYDIEDLPRN